MSYSKFTRHERAAIGVGVLTGVILAAGVVADKPFLAVAGFALLVLATFLGAGA